MDTDAKTSSLLEARNVWLSARTASLSVLDFDTGGPLGGLVNVAVTEKFEPIILTSSLSRHTQSLDRDGRASLMATGTLPSTGDALTGFRATLTGLFTRTNDPALRASFLAHHPYAELYAGFGDFGFWVMAPAKLYVVAGFGRVYTYNASQFSL